ncbi:unnamed protein product [Victoria cruziana]
MIQLKAQATKWQVFLRQCESFDNVTCVLLWCTLSPLSYDRTTVFSEDVSSFVTNICGGFPATVDLVKLIASSTHHI